MTPDQKIIIAGAAMVLAILGVVVGISRTPAITPLPLDHATPSDWTKGAKEAKLTLIEYGDFQCPACAAYEPMVDQFNKEFGTTTQTVYRNFPLTTIHKHAQAAAQAAEAAGLQGKYWDMHNMLFEHQDQWVKNSHPADIFTQYAATLKLDIDKFNTDKDSEAIATKIRNDRASGEKAGVNGTPSFFLNGTKLQNPRSYEELKNLITAIK